MARRDPSHFTCSDPGTAVRLKAGACVLMHTITLCYSHHPVSPRLIKSELTLGISEVLVYGLPVSDGFTLPVRITRGCLYWAPCVSAPRLSVAWFRTHCRQRRVCVCRGCSATTPLSVHHSSKCASAGRPLVLACAARGARAGDFSCTVVEGSSSISSLVFCIIAGIVYAYLYTKGIRSKNGELPLW